MAHSVRDRLLAIAHRDGADFNILLTRYVVERFLYRLSLSEHRERFVLKGAMLFAVWVKKEHRPTRDLDLLGYGEFTEDGVRTMFGSILAVVVPDDGVIFDTDSIEVSEIRAEEEYRGRRVRVTARIGAARIHLQVDIGTGDAVLPAPRKVKFPVLLESMPAPQLRAYTMETVVAEKLQAMASLGMLNSRMKDLYDLWTLSNSFEFEGVSLVRAIEATFDRRKTVFTEELPAGLTDEFARDSAKQIQWNAFLRNHKLEAGLALNDITRALRVFLEEPYRAAANRKTFAKHWQAGVSKWS